jgi:hypothetical protein
MPPLRLLAARSNPSLVGTYEAKLDAVFETLFTQTYERIVDVGCAEVFYAIGLVLKLPGCTVTAHDTDPRARNLCRDDDALNGVTAEVTIEGAVHANELATLVNGRRNLIICDCEGYEHSLFPAEHLPAYIRSTIVPETHDFIKVGVCDRLASFFRATNRVQIIHSVDDPQKASTYRSDWVGPSDGELKELVFGEVHPVIMQWLYLTLFCSD